MSTTNPSTLAWQQPCYQPQGVHNTEVWGTSQHKTGKNRKNLLDQHNSCKWGLYISSRWMLNQYGNMKLNYNYDIVPSLYTTLPSFGMRCCVSTWTTYRQRLRHSSTTTQWTPTPSKPQDLKTTNSELKHQIHNSSIKHLILDLYSSTQTNIEKLMFYVLFFISSGQPPPKNPRQETWRSHHLRLFNLPFSKAKTSRSFSSPWVCQEGGTFLPVEFTTWGMCVFFFTPFGWLFVWIFWRGFRELRKSIGYMEDGDIFTYHVCLLWMKQGVG